MNYIIMFIQLEVLGYKCVFTKQPKSVSSTAQSSLCDTETYLINIP